MADPHGIHKAPSDFLDPWLVDRALPVPPPEGSPPGITSRETPGRAVAGGQPVRVGLGLQTVRLGFRRSRAAHRCSPPVSSATTPIPPCPSHALPGKGPGRRPREAPAGPGGWNAGGGPRGAPRFCPGESHGLTSSALGGRIPGENPAWAWGDPAGKLRKARGETPWESPGGHMGGGG
jgi:hypothetical protein